MVMREKISFLEAKKPQAWLPLIISFIVVKKFHSRGFLFSFKTCHVVKHPYLMNQQILFYIWKVKSEQSCINTVGKCRIFLIWQILREINFGYFECRGEFLQSCRIEMYQNKTNMLIYLWQRAFHKDFWESNICVFTTFCYI